jgi:O-antigen/teichoic acid export membrane protein
MTEFEVGLYNAALPTAMLVLLPHHAIGSLAVTSFSELKEKDEESIESSLQTATYWVFSLVLPTSLIMFLFSEQVLNILFGSVYTQASVALSILSCGYLLDSAVGRVGSFLQSKGYTKYILYNNVAALGLNIGLNIVLIPVYGIVGAAIATAGSTILTNLLMFIEVWKKEGVISIPFKRIGRVILTAILPLAFIIGLDNLLFDQTPFWFLFVGCIIYFILYLALFLKILGLGEDEKEVFLRIGEITGFRGKVQVIIERLGKI